MTMKTVSTKTKRYCSTLTICLLSLTLSYCTAIKPKETVSAGKPVVPSYDLEFAKTQFNAGHYDMAEYYLKKALMTLPDDPSALKLLPWSYFYQNRFDRSLIAFQHLQSRYPKDPEPLVGMGWSYFGLFNYEKALESFERAEELSPDSFQAIKGKAFALLKLYQSGRAEEEFKKIYSEDDVDNILELWETWQGEKPETVLNIVPQNPAVPTLFTLPVESPRYPSAILGQNPGENKKLIDQGWALLNDKKYTKALTTFRKLHSNSQLVNAFKDMPDKEMANELDAHNGLAWSYLHTGQINKADEEFHSILRKHPQFAGALEGLREVEKERLKKASHAHHYFDIGKYTIANDRFKKMTEDYPQWTHPYNQMGLVDLQTGKQDSARENFQKALDLDPTDKNARDGLAAIKKAIFPELYKADQALKEANYKTAARLYYDFIESQDKSAELTEIMAHAYNGLAWSLFWKKQYAMAIAKFEKISDYPSLEFSSAKGTGFCYFYLANYAKAAEYLQIADEIMPDHKYIVPKLDWSILRSMNPRKSEQHFKNVLLRNPLRYSAYLGLGWIYYSGGKPDLGVEYFLKSIELDPDFALTNEFKEMLDGERFGWQVYNQLGWAYYHRQHYTRALELFRVSLDREPNRSETLKGIGYSLYYLKSYSQAVTFLQKSLSVNPWPKPVVEVVMKDNAITPFKIRTSVLTKLGRSYYEMGKYQEALLQFNQELQHNPDWPEIYDGLGWCNLKLNRLTEARASFNQALHYQPLLYSSKIGLDEVKQKMLSLSLESTAVSNTITEKTLTNP